MLVVDTRVLFSVTATLPPPHGKNSVKPPLYWVVVAVMGAPAAVPPETVVVDAVAADLLQDVGRG